MKIVMLETSGLGGIAHYTYNLCQSLAEHLNIVLITNVRYELEEHHRTFDLHKVIRSEQSYLKKVFRVAGIIKREKPDILHIQSILTARKDWLLFTVLKLLGCPVVLTVHNIFPHDTVERLARGMRFSFNRIYASCRALIVHSEWSKQEFLSNFRVNAQKVFSIPHGNYLFFSKNKDLCKKEVARMRLGLDMNDKVILSFGVMREYKGIEQLIVAFLKTHAAEANARLIIVGHVWKENAERYRQLIKEHNLEELVLFIPKYVSVEEIPLYFTCADVAVFPYLHTYGSGALQTAYSFSKPVVVTRVGIFNETV
jgi:glycosyltransferase involved in cell wall biosynthesis